MGILDKLTDLLTSEQSYVSSCSLPRRKFYWNNYDSGTINKLAAVGTSLLNKSPTFDLAASNVITDFFWWSPIHLATHAETSTQNLFDSAFEIFR